MLSFVFFSDVDFELSTLFVAALSAFIDGCSVGMRVSDFLFSLSPQAISSAEANKEKTNTFFMFDSECLINYKKD